MFYRHANLQRTYKSKIVMFEESTQQFSHVVTTKGRHGI
jgi:hypothetical protein